VHLLLHLLWRKLPCHPSRGVYFFCYSPNTLLEEMRTLWRWKLAPTLTPNLWPFEPKISRLWHSVKDCYFVKFQVILIRGFCFILPTYWHTYTPTYIMTTWSQYWHAWRSTVTPIIAVTRYSSVLCNEYNVVRCQLYVPAEWSGIAQWVECRSSPVNFPRVAPDCYLDG